MMDAPRISNEEIEKGVDKFSKGKLEYEEEKRVVHVLEETEGKDDAANANGEQKDERGKIDSPEKPKKTNHKTNVTVPRPFSLATEKRMMRERKGSMDFKESKPILSKSASFNHKISHQKGSGSSFTRKSLQPKVLINGKDDKNTEKISSMKDNSQEKDVEKNGLPTKGGDRMKAGPKENSTFKALPLPDFYRQKDCPPKSEAEKMVNKGTDLVRNLGSLSDIPLTKEKDRHLKPGAMGDQVKTLSRSDGRKTEGNATRVSKEIGGGAKQTISKVIRNPKNTLRTSPKETI